MFVLRTSGRFGMRAGVAGCIVRAMGRVTPTRSLMKRLRQEQVVDADERLIASTWVRFAMAADSRGELELLEALKRRDANQLHLTSHQWVIELRDRYYHAPLATSDLTPHGARTGRFEFNDNLLYVVAKTDRELRRLADAALAAKLAAS